jgi:hypothetical protein
MVEKLRAASPIGNRCKLQPAIVFAIAIFRLLGTNPHFSWLSFTVFPGKKKASRIHFQSRDAKFGATLNSPNSPRLLTVLFEDSVDVWDGSVNGSGVRWAITSVP